MNFIDTKEIHYINGYLNALSDMSGKNYEFFGKVFLSKNNNTESILKMLSLHMNNTCSVIEKKIIKNYSLPDILNQLIILKPYSELYGSLENNIIPKNIETKYKKYIVDRLSDAIYDIYHTSKDCNSSKETSSLTLILAKNTNEDNCIVLIETKNNCNLVFYFYYRLGTTEEYLSLYNKIKDQPDKSNINIISASGFSNITVDRLTRVLNKIQSQGFMNDELKNILLEYYSEEKIKTLKEIYKI
ncbi:MAG: hypothetical protein L3J43_11570 [Sulfurovum sp.]|nr:hypothetical protein [Sulfurovum sp.]